MAAHESVGQLRWCDAGADVRAALTGRLVGLWGAPTDEAAFDALAVDKQQALLLLLRRMMRLALWPVVRRVTNVYGVGGVGMAFDAWPVLAATLARRRDFTRRFARHTGTAAGFYERGRSTCVLHFIRVRACAWQVHFDLHSPAHTPASLLRHLRHEKFGRLRPDWRAIKAALDEDDG